MFNSISHLIAARAMAVDGEIGPIRDALFDGHRWAIRYLVVDASAWLAERDVLISPYSIRQPVGYDRQVGVALTRRLIAASPDVDTALPVTRRQERALMMHYHYPGYWQGDGLWSMRAMPSPKLAPLAFAVPEPRPAVAANGGAVEARLFGVGEVLGLEVHAQDGVIGEVLDIVFDDESWLIRYLIVDTRGWWPTGHTALIGLHWLAQVDWGLQRMHVALTRGQVQASPAYQDVASIHRDYEVRLHENYGRAGYWA